MKFTLWKKAAPKRIELIDGLRGLSILLMVAYHFGYDLILFAGAPSRILHNPIFDFLQPVFAGVFIFLSGLSCRFSRKNLLRGLAMFAIGWVVTIVTYFVGVPAWFGILHFLGSASMIFGAAQLVMGRFFEKSYSVKSEISRRRSDILRGLAILLCAILFVITQRYLNSRYFGIPGMWWLGLRQQGFRSSDYFPLLPWIFIHLAGTVFGKWVVEKRLPERFYSLRVPFFAAVGRNTFLIYILHQPVCFLVVCLITLF